MQQAKTLAPQESRVFIQYAGYIMSSNLENSLSRLFRNGERTDQRTFLLLAFSENCAASLTRAAELDTRNPRVICQAPYWRWSHAMIENNFAITTLNEMPDVIQKDIHRTFIKLEELSHDSDEKVAAQAWECLGYMHFLTIHNSKEAIADLKQSVLLDPSREIAWNMLLAITLNVGTPEDLVTISKERLRIKNSARNHLYLAKSFVYMKKWNEAENEALMAGTMDTNDIVPVLFVAALAIKQGDNPRSVSIAEAALSKARELSYKIPTDKDTPDRWREYNLNAAILLGIKGQSGEAAKYANDVLKHFPNDEDAKNILNALN